MLDHGRWLNAIGAVERSRAHPLAIHSLPFVFLLAGDAVASEPTWRPAAVHTRAHTTGDRAVALATRRGEQQQRKHSHGANAITVVRLFCSAYERFLLSLLSSQLQFVISI